MIIKCQPTKKILRLGHQVSSYGGTFENYLIEQVCALRNGLSTYWTVTLGQTHCQSKCNQPSSVTAIMNQEMGEYRIDYNWCLGSSCYGDYSKSKYRVFFLLALPKKVEVWKTNAR